MTMNYQQVIDDICKTIQAEENKGEVAGYIPELAKVDPDQFGVYYLSVDNESHHVGNWDTKFSIQSISKVLSLSLAYKLLGDRIWERVGVEPSGSAFNSLIQLETDNGIPRNPFINGGALVICDMLMSHLTDPVKDFMEYVRGVSSCSDIHYSETIAQSELSVGYRNRALCNFIKSFGNLENDPEEVLKFYFTVCSLEMTCWELTHTFMFLANSNLKIKDEKAIPDSSQLKRINAIMQTCGFYDESGEFSFKVGLAGKSGVGGGIVALLPGKYCISVWSPKLNSKGNSYRGMKFLERFTTETNLSIF
jgi:glutaminase